MQAYKKFILLSFASVFLATSVFAANEVTVSDNTTLTLGSSEFILLAGSKLDSLTINSDNFQFVMSQVGKATLESNDGKIFSTSDINKSTTCTDTKSSIVIELDAGDSDGKTITITPSSKTCSSIGAAPATSSGGGGTGTTGGGSAAPTFSPQQQPTTPSPQQEIVAPPETPSDIMFHSDLIFGMQNEDVTRLQILLARNPSLYPEGLVTSYFGSLTRKAVERFQEKYGITQAGRAGFGRVGPLTRAKLQEVFGGAIPSQTTVTPPVTLFSTGLRKGMSSADVKKLQQLLNTDPDTRISDAGVGSQGNETTYFGALTEKAVEHFQEKYDIAKSGDAGYGYVGPKTRAKLQEIFSSSVPSSADTASIQAQIDAANAQLQTLLQQLQQISQ